MLESDLERYARNCIKLHGGKMYKWVSPGCVGAPDRIAVFPAGQVVFLEFKRPGVKDGLSPRQVKEIANLKKLGAEVYVIRSKAEIEEVIKNHVI